MSIRRLALLLPMVSLACQPPSVERVVLVSIDTLRADHVGAYGGTRPTPHLDAVAGGGVRFATAISPAPITLPSHVSLLTGLDPPRHGVRNNSTFRLSEDLPTLASAMRDAGFATAAFVGAMVLDRQYGLARGFDVYDDRMSPRLSAGEDGVPERRADEVIDAVLAWLESAPPRFLLFVHLYDPHASYRAPAAFRRAHPGSPYFAEVAFTDHELGRLLAALEAIGGDETLLVVTSDHGESLGEHGELTHTLSVYDATQRVPLLLRGPGVPRGEVIESPVRLVDVAPTVLSLAGVAPLPDSDGRDLTASMRGEPGETPVAYLETLSTQLDMGWSPLLGVRSARWKYVRAPRPELYDLSADPREERNLHAERKDVAGRLDRELARLLSRGRPVEPNLTPDAESQALLESLGYATVDPGGGVRFGLGRVGGLDPKDGLANLGALIAAWNEASRQGSAEALARLAEIEGGGFFRFQVGAQAALDTGDAGEALRYARAAVKAAPEFWESHNTLGRALLAASRLDEAEQAFRATAALNGAAGDPLVGLGRVAESRGARERAILLYARAGERRGNSSEARWRLAALHIEAGDDLEAEALLSRVPAERLHEPAAALRLAEAERSRGRPTAARERLERALAKRPEHLPLRAAREALDEG